MEDIYKVSIIMELFVMKNYILQVFVWTKMSQKCLYSIVLEEDYRLSIKFQTGEKF